LRQMKVDHEALVLGATGDAIARQRQPSPLNYVRETVYSTLFPVVVFPQYLYGAPCQYDDGQADEIRARIVLPTNKDEIYPYVIRLGMLYTFQKLDDPYGPFGDLIGRGGVKRFLAREWWDDPDRSIWLMTLLNRSLNKLTGRRKLQLDRDHHRYYFAPDEPGKIKEMAYRPLNQAVTSRQVVWQPINKQTGEPRPYWLHRAVGLKFHRVGLSQWCLSIRPEYRVTKDGVTPLASEKIGAKVTRKKSRTFNYDLLGDLQFWRDYLSDSKPRFIFNFGKNQPLIVSTNMMQAEVVWPGIPEEYAKPFKNVSYVDDLFTWAEMARFAQLTEGDVSLDDEDEWEETDDEEWGEGDDVE